MHVVVAVDQFQARSQATCVPTPRPSITTRHDRPCYPRIALYRNSSNRGSFRRRTMYFHLHLLELTIQMTKPFHCLPPTSPLKRPPQSTMSLPQITQPSSSLYWSIQRQSIRPYAAKLPIFFPEYLTWRLHAKPNSMIPGKL